MGGNPSLSPGTLMVLPENLARYYKTLRSSLVLCIWIQGSNIEDLSKSPSHFFFTEKPTFSQCVSAIAVETQRGTLG